MKGKAKKLDKYFNYEPSSDGRGKEKGGSQKAVIKYDPLQRYLTEISQYRLLTRDEERALAKRVRKAEMKKLHMYWLPLI